MRLLLITVLCVSYLFSNEIDITKNAITIGSFRALENVNIVSKDLQQLDLDVYIYKTTATVKPWYVVYAINILESKKDKILKKVRQSYPTAYLTSKNRLEFFIKNDSEKDIVVNKIKKQIIKTTKAKKKVDFPHITQIVQALVYEKNKRDQLIPKPKKKIVISKVKKMIPKPKKKIIVPKVEKIVKIIPKKDSKQREKIVSFELLREKYTINNNTNSVNGLGIILGLEDSNYRKFINFKITDGLNILGTYEYLYRLKDKNFFFAGLSAGYGIYLTPYTKEYYQGFTYGISYGLKFSHYEIGMQNLRTNMEATNNTSTYKLDKTNFIYFRYRF